MFLCNKSVLFRVLLRNRINMACICLIMQSNKSQDLQWFGMLETQKEPKLQPVCKGKKKASIQVQRHSGRENHPLLQGGSALFFKSKLQLIDWSPITLGRVFCLIQSDNLNVNLIQKAPSETSRIMFDQVSRHPGPSQFSPVQSLSHDQHFETPLTAERQTSRSITNSQSYRNLCPLSQWCHPIISSLPFPPTFNLSQYTVLSNELVLCIK